MSVSYRVIEIIDEFSVIVNYGIRNGAKPGNTVRVIAVGPDVIDPSTGESLGTYDAIKSELSVVRAYTNFSVCKEIVITTFNALISPLTQFQKNSSTIQKLNVDHESKTHISPPDDMVIRVGDLVEVL